MSPVPSSCTKAVWEQGRAACILAHRRGVCSPTLLDLPAEWQLASKLRLAAENRGSGVWCRNLKSLGGDGGCAAGFFSPRRPFRGRGAMYSAGAVLTTGVQCQSPAGITSLWPRVSARVGVPGWLAGELFCICRWGQIKAGLKEKEEKKGPIATIWPLYGSSVSSDIIKILCTHEDNQQFTLMTPYHAPQQTPDLILCGEKSL